MSTPVEMSYSIEPSDSHLVVDLTGDDSDEQVPPWEKSPKTEILRTSDGGSFKVGDVEIGDFKTDLQVPTTGELYFNDKMGYLKTKGEYIFNIRMGYRDRPVQDVQAEEFTAAGLKAKLRAALLH